MNWKNQKSPLFLILVVLSFFIFTSMVSCGGGGGGGGGDTPLPTQSPTVTPGATVSGTVLDINSQPLAEATVEYGTNSLNTEGRANSTITDLNGNYILTGVPEGNRLITAYKGNYARSSEIEVTTGGSYVVDLQVTPAGSVSGVIYDNNSQLPIQGAKVSMTIPQSRFVVEETTDSSGLYSFIHIPEGSYSVTAFKSGYAIASGSVEVVMGNTSSLNLYLEPSSSPTPTPSPTPSPIPSPNPNDWMSYTNYYRGMSQVQPLSENSSWSSDCEKHAFYIVKNDILEHDEDPSNQYYTPEGRTAAQSSDLAASYDMNDGVKFTLETWMQAPFHAIAILDPALRTSGYGIYHEDDGGLVMGAALDVVRGRTAAPSDTPFPIKFPGDGSVINLRLHWGETPDPLTSCPGYTAPVGLPITLQLGSGNITPSVTAHSFTTESGTALEHCVFDETNYYNPSDYEQYWIRSILDQRDAIVLIPKEPLSPGETYKVSITTNGNTYAWSFKVSEDAKYQRIGNNRLIR